MPAAPDRFVVRLRFWPLWVRLNVALQLGGTALLVALFLVRSSKGVPILRPGEPPYFLLQPVLVTVLGTVIAVVLWGCTRTVLTPAGIQWVSPTEGKDWAFGWAEFTEVVRGFDLIAGRSWHLPAPRGKGVRLPMTPADPIGFREAVERFAGPDHPLTQAIDTDGT